MFGPHIMEIEASLSESDIVLDVGAWHKPYCRADYVLDLLPYATRGVGGRVGRGPERFTADTWIIHDINSRRPLPFADKQFDYVICSHTLEDIRDPIHVCSELIRVGKRGYIEVPSRLIESSIGVESSRYAGFYHHRWLVEIDGSSITFRFKPHLLHESRRVHFPKRFIEQIPEERRVSWLFWEESFRYRELIQVSGDLVRLELEQFVNEHYPLSIFERTRTLLHPREFRRSLGKIPALRRAAMRIAPSRFTDGEGWNNMPELEST